MFRYYPFEYPNQLTFKDYGSIIDIVKQYDIKNAVEFGPGWTTGALIEAGVKRIVSLEHVEAWRERAWHRWATVTIEAGVDWELACYRNLHPVRVPRHVDWAKFDLCLVDSPYAGAKAELTNGCGRLNTLEWALSHARVVLLHDINRKGEQQSINACGATVERLGSRMGRIWRA